MSNIIDKKTPESIYKAFARNIIKNSNSDEQIDFLKIYPAFESNIKIMELWINIYCDFHGNIKTNRYTIQTISYTKKKENIINFLISGLSYDYIESACIFKVLNMMEKYNEDSAFINAIKLHSIHYKVGNNIPYTKSISLKSINEISYVIRNNPDKSKFSSARQSTVDFNRDIKFVNSKDFAFELTRRFSELLLKISTHELVYASMYDNIESFMAPNICALTAEFNKMSYLVPTEILVRKRDNSGRKKVLVKFIKFAKELMKLGNYHAVFAITSGLNHNSIQRIKSLWKIKRKHKTSFDELNKFTSSKNNFSYYRNFIKQRKATIIPYIGIIKSDIKHMLEIKLINTEVNMGAYNKLLNVIKTFETSKKHFNVAINPGLSAFFNNLLVTMDDDKLHDLSLGTDNEIQTMLNNGISLIKTGKMKSESKSLKIITQSDNRLMTKSLMLPLNKINRNKRSMSICSGIDSPRNYTDDMIVGRSKSVDNGINKEPDEVMCNKSVESWTNKQVLSWLDKIDMSQYKNRFEQEDITGFSLVELTEDHLKSVMGVNRLGHRIKIIKCIIQLKTT